MLFLVTQMELGGSQKMMLRIADGIRGEGCEVFAGCFYYKNTLNRMPDELGLPVIDFHLKEPGRTNLLKRAWLFVSGYYRLYRFLRKERIDVLQTFCYYANVLGVLVGRCARVPVIITSQRNAYHSKGRVALLIDRIAASLTTKVVAVCKAVEQFSIENERFRPDKILSIPNGIDMAAVCAQHVDVAKKRQELGLDANRLIFGCVARLHPRKGHEYLLRAFPSVLESVPHAALLLVGDGTEKNKLEHLACELDIGDRVTLLGWRTDVSELIECFDVFVLPSLEEGFPNVLLEAMARGKPVIATDVDGNVEVARDGVTGLLVPAADTAALAGAMLSMANDPDVMARYGQQGRALVEREYSLARTIERFRELYLAEAARAKLQYDLHSNSASDGVRSH